MKAMFVTGNDECELFESVLSDKSIKFTKKDAATDNGTRYDFEVEDGNQAVLIGYVFGTKMATKIFNRNK